ncbi:MAG: hypothetical protein QM723_05475 [Myxococcaceae bacterium]
MGGELCFPDGCGDPGSGLVAEISGDSSAGLNPQDFALGDAGFAPVQNFSFSEPMTLSGNFQRNTQDATKPVPYLYATNLILLGESALIPGVARSYQASFIGSDQGSFSISVGAGTYTTIASAADTSVPPLREPGLQIEPGDEAMLTFQFPSVTATLALKGKLIKKTELTVPPTQINLTASSQAMNITAYDPNTGLALSQVTQVASGFPSSMGDFTIYIDPSARAASAINLVATPKDPNSVMASKIFTLSNSNNPASPYPTGDQLVLEMGDFGDPLPALYLPDAGMTLPRVLTSDGQPVANAIVSLEGPVASGGTFKSSAVTTDELGQFSIASLPSDPQAAFTLTVIPPTTSPAGITKRQVTVTTLNGGTITPGDVLCDDKVVVSGTLQRPDRSTPAAGVLVTAVPISALPGDPTQPLPKSVMQTNTDVSGNFKLLLDPRVWRLEFSPGETLPLTSIVLHVAREMENGQIKPVCLNVNCAPFPLWKGRQVGGHVSAPKSRGGGPAAFSTVRFFRVDSVEQQPSSLLLGEAVVDAQGNYTLVLPTATDPATASQ